MDEESGVWPANHTNARVGGALNIGIQEGSIPVAAPAAGDLLLLLRWWRVERPNRRPRSSAAPPLISGRASSVQAHDAETTGAAGRGGVRRGNATGHIVIFCTLTVILAMA
jgi:hypothetical protein